MENAVDRLADQTVPLDVRVEAALRPGTELLRSPAKLQPAPRRIHAPVWPQWSTAFWSRWLRGLIQRSFLFPLLSLTFRVNVRGLQNLDGLDAPTIFAANHAHPADHLLILQAMPRAVRARMAIAAGAEQWGTWGKGVLYPLMGNGFPLARNGPIRASLENLAHVLADGWSILIFPEGKLSKGGPMQPFKGGVGFCAVTTGVQVVPLRLHVRALGVPWFFPLWKRGRVDVVFGEPLRIPTGASHRVATRMIHKAVASL